MSVRRLIPPVVVAIFLVISNVLSVQGAGGPRVPSLAGTWVVQTTCLPRCYADPRLNHNTSTATVALKLRSSGKAPYYFSPKGNRFAISAVTVISINPGLALLHTNACSMQLRVQSAPVSLIGSGIKVIQGKSRVFVARLLSVWTRGTAIVGQSPSSGSFADQIRTDSHLPVGC